RMFPTVRVSFSGPLRQVTPADRYVVLLDVVPVDNRRYRYAYHRSAWLVAGKADPPPPGRLYAHPDTPLGADALRKQVISFEKVKLTNNEMDKNGQSRSRELYAMDPMDALLFEQHLRSPLRLFPDPLMAQFASGSFAPQDLQDPASMALLEKARQQLQLWGRSPYSELLLPQMYPRPPNLGGLGNLGLWQGSPPGGGGGWSPGPSLPHGFLPNAAAGAPPPTTTPPLSGSPSAAPSSLSSPGSLTPGGSASTGSAAADPRMKHFTRFTPYQVPQHHLHPAHPSRQHPPPRTPPLPGPSTSGSPRSPSN
ncbi:T-box protein H15-like, partial [Anopheles cruzii]|uniref:T-box protein H15-like n=1 Tax=Anopheles cruzii TaxID=68878 RepID=UPI0022EC40AA